uniref:Mu-like prophage I protein n=1 Tax=Candidatus Kentrum sp. LFY TaxID=2126342 RepID=A0A450WGV5_9GAMM|nr:MAG: hypothetical protein BECKLFY1418C_GA0070996_102219 [Candidatus Kentron sp. LFY]
MGGGEDISFSEADLQACAAAYDPEVHEAPLVIGHPVTDTPAQGWVASMETSRGNLYVHLRDVDPAFAERVDKREYAKVSARLYRPSSPANPVPGVWYLRHVGFVPIPAIKGLEDPSSVGFADDADCVVFQEDVAFGEDTDWAIAAIARGLRDWILVKFGAEDADKAIPSWYVQTLEAAAREETEENDKPAFAESSERPDSGKTITESDTTMTEEEIKKLQAENDRLKADLDRRDKDAAKKEEQRRHDDNAAFAEQLIGEGRLVPKHQDTLVAVLDVLGAPDEDGSTVQFGEGDEARPLSSALREMLADNDPMVEFGETAVKHRVAPKGEENPLLVDAESRA